MPSTMETILLLACSTITILIVIPLIVRMAQKGLGVLPRLYVAIFGVALMLVSQAAVTGHRVFGYLPELTLAIAIAAGFIAALVAAYSDPDRNSDRVGVFRSLF